MCGITYLSNVSGEASTEFSQQILKNLKCADSRGGVTGDTGHGAGLTTDLPHFHYQEQFPDANLKAGKYVAGNFHFGNGIDGASLDEEKKKVREALTEQGLKVVGWIKTDAKKQALSNKSQESLPQMWQVVAIPQDDNKENIEQSALKATRELEKQYLAEDGNKTHIASLSSKAITWKTLCRPSELVNVLPIIQDPRYAKSFGIVQARFATGSNPEWENIQPVSGLKVTNGETTSIIANIIDAEANGMEKRHNRKANDAHNLSNIIDDRRIENNIALEDAVRSIALKVVKDGDPRYNDEVKAYLKVLGILHKAASGPMHLVALDGDKTVIARDSNGLRPSCITLYEQKDQQGNWDIYFADESEQSIPVNDENIRIIAQPKVGPGDVLVFDRDAEGLKELIAKYKDNNKDAAKRLEIAKQISEMALIPDHKLLARQAKEFRIKINGKKLTATEFIKRQVKEISAIDDIPDSQERSAVAERKDKLSPQQEAIAFYWNQEEAQRVIYMAEKGASQGMAMGNDNRSPAYSTEHPVAMNRLSENKIGVAVAPTLDHYREGKSSFVMDAYIGNKEKGLLHVDSPILVPADVDRIKHEKPTAKLDMTFAVGDNLEDALKKLGAMAVEAVEEGAEFVVVDDRNIGKERAQIPDVLAVSAVNQALKKAGLRDKAAVVVESGSAKDAHDHNMLIAYGADAVCAWKAYEYIGKNIAENIAIGDKKGQGTERYKKHEKNYRNGITERMASAMSKRCINRADIYQGACSGVFESYGLKVEGYLAELLENIDQYEGKVSLKDLEHNAKWAQHLAVEAEADARLPKHGLFSDNREDKGDPHANSGQVVKAFQTMLSEEEIDETKRKIKVEDTVTQKAAVVAEIKEKSAGRIEEFNEKREEREQFFQEHFKKSNEFAEYVKAYIKESKEEGIEVTNLDIEQYKERRLKYSKEFRQYLEEHFKAYKEEKAQQEVLEQEETEELKKPDSDIGSDSDIAESPLPFEAEAGAGAASPAGSIDSGKADSPVRPDVMSPEHYMQHSVAQLMVKELKDEGQNKPELYSFLPYGVFMTDKMLGKLSQNERMIKHYLEKPTNDAEAVVKILSAPGDYKFPNTGKPPTLQDEFLLNPKEYHDLIERLFEVPEYWEWLKQESVVRDNYPQVDKVNPVNPFEDLGRKDKQAVQLFKGWLEEKEQGVSSRVRRGLDGEIIIDSESFTSDINSWKATKPFKEYMATTQGFKREKPITMLNRVQIKEKSDNPAKDADMAPISEFLGLVGAGAMSYGSLSSIAHEDIRYAHNVENTLGSNDGEGAVPSEDYLDPAKNGKYKQRSGGFFGHNPKMLAAAKENDGTVDYKNFQAAKGGSGGNLPGQKVSVEIAIIRGAMPGEELASPSIRYEEKSIEDLKAAIEAIHAAGAKASVKIGATYDSLLVGLACAAAGADEIEIAGDDGAGTGSAKTEDILHTGTPFLKPLLQLHKALTEEGIRNKVKLTVSGGIATIDDAVKAYAAGADGIKMGTHELMKLGCDMERQCNRAAKHNEDGSVTNGGCSKGITNTPHLYGGKSEDIMRYNRNFAALTRERFRELGYESPLAIRGKLAEIVTNRDELTDDIRKLILEEAKAPEFSKTMQQWDDKKETDRQNRKDVQLVEQIKEIRQQYPGKKIVISAIEKGEENSVRFDDESGKVFVKSNLCNLTIEDRSFGVALGTEFVNNFVRKPVDKNGDILPQETWPKLRDGQEYVDDDFITLKTKGNPGVRFGNYLCHGFTIHADIAQDYVGGTSCGGRLFISPPENSQEILGSDARSFGNASAVGTDYLEIYATGGSGDRFGARSSGGVFVVESTGSFLGQYATFGTFVITGDEDPNNNRHNCGIGIGSGAAGAMFAIYNENGNLGKKVDKDSVALLSDKSSNEDINNYRDEIKGDYQNALLKLIQTHAEGTGSKRSAYLVANWEKEKEKENFSFVIPKGLLKTMDDLIAGDAKQNASARDKIEKIRIVHDKREEPITPFMRVWLNKAEAIIEKQKQQAKGVIEAISDKMGDTILPCEISLLIDSMQEIANGSAPAPKSADKEVPRAPFIERLLKQQSNSREITLGEQSYVIGDGRDWKRSLREPSKLPVGVDGAVQVRDMEEGSNCKTTCNTCGSSGCAIGRDIPDTQTAYKNLIDTIIIENNLAADVEKDLLTSFVEAKLKDSAADKRKNLLGILELPEARQAFKKLIKEGGISLEHSGDKMSPADQAIDILLNGKIEQGSESYNKLKIFIETQAQSSPNLATGMICPARCEDLCTIVSAEGPVDIRKTEAIAALLDKKYPEIIDQAFFDPFDPNKEQQLAHGGKTKKVKIVGGGPAGLEAARVLSKYNDIEVTVIEREQHVGGLQRYGIPIEKGVASMSEKYKERLERVGVKFETGRAARREDLQDADHVIIATGVTDYPRELSGNTTVYIEEEAETTETTLEEIGGREKISGVMQAMDLLTAENKALLGEGDKQYDNIGQERVAVVGGGDTATDGITTVAKYIKDSTGHLIVLERSETRNDLPSVGQRVTITPDTADPNRENALAKLGDKAEVFELTTPAALYVKRTEDGKYQLTGVGLQGYKRSAAGMNKFPKPERGETEKDGPPTRRDLDRLVLAMGFNRAPQQDLMGNLGLDIEKVSFAGDADNKPHSRSLNEPKPDTVVSAMQSGIDAADAAKKAITKLQAKPNPWRARKRRPIEYDGQPYNGSEKPATVARGGNW